MKQLTLKCKLAFLDNSILELTKLELTKDPSVEYLLCCRFDNWMLERHNIDMIDWDEVGYYFPEFWIAIQKALKRTNAEGSAIQYKRPVSSRIKLLKRVKKLLK